VKITGKVPVEDSEVVTTSSWKTAAGKRSADFHAWSLGVELQGKKGRIVLQGTLFRVPFLLSKETFRKY
jgi:hypothetical protein